ncbi:MAG: twin-arginine translocation signal domain-containing protein [Gemmatimonadetes bacterium]|nr:twin-arginine translocation signal domain-containing protein [Gemmatimonadota bacterium]
MTSRRRFLEASGTLAAAAALGGCADVSAWRALWTTGEDGTFAAPRVDGDRRDLARDCPPHVRRAPR